MKESKHAEARRRQRGIAQKTVDFIMEHGDARMKPGGAWEVRLSRSKKQKMITDLKRTRQLIEKCTSKGLLLNQDQSEIITVYHLR